MRETQRDHGNGMRDHGNGMREQKEREIMAMGERAKREREMAMRERKRTNELFFFLLTRVIE